MRTKVLCAAALAAGALTSMAQVYSANVVGYVNVTVPGNGAYTLLANPLDGTMGGTVANGNNISTLFAGKAQDGDTIYRWNPTVNDFDGVQPSYSTDLNAWSSDFAAAPGEGFFYINNNNNITVTFVGQVVQGNWTYQGGLHGTPGTILGNGSYNAIGSPVPLGGCFTNAIAGITPQDGDTIYPWDNTVNDFSGTQPTYSSDLAAWSTTAVNSDPGTGLIYINNNNNVTWTRNFTVQ